MGARTGGPQRYTRGLECPICGGSQNDERGVGKRCHGFISGCGGYAHCTREDLGGEATFHANSQTYSHRLKGPCKCGVEHAPADPKPERPAKGKGGAKSKIVATYPYADEQGKLLFEVVRHEPKDFRQRRPGKFPNTWIHSIEGIRRVLYRLPELVAADPASPVVLVEGEKDVDALRSLGLVATCNPMGAGKGGGKWMPGYTESLSGRVVWIAPDNDDDGRKHSAMVAATLTKAGNAVRVVDLAALCRTLGLGELVEKGDVSDFLAMGGTVDQFTSAFLSAEVYRIAAKSAKAGAERSYGATGTDGAAVGGGRGHGFNVVGGDDDHDSDHRAVREDDDRDGSWINRTDLGNARRLVAKYGDRIRFHSTWQVWLTFDGRRWKEDMTGEIHRLAKRTVGSIYREAAAAADESKREAIAKWAITSESRSRLDNMVTLAKTEPGVMVTPEQLDTDPMLFNARNGTIDLRTGLLRKHRREDLITKMAEADYDPAAPAPVWEGFLEKVLGKHEGLAAFVARAIGYAMTADTSEQCLFFLHGEGANGKSTLLDIIEQVYGDYAITIDPKILTSKDRDEHSTELCDLDGPRFINTVEVDDGRRMAEGLVKRLTGGPDKIRARRMRQNPYQFKPLFKLFLAANHKPIINGTDHGIWRRIRMIPFDYRITDAEKDEKFGEKLLATERAGILAWCVRGCLDWQAGKLRPPAVVTDATAEYRKDMDSIQKFIDQRCTVLRGSLIEGVFKDIYAGYKQWCDEYGLQPLGGKRFGMELTAKGFPKRESNNRTLYRGIVLGRRADPVSDEDPNVINFDDPMEPPSKGRGKVVF